MTDSYLPECAEPENSDRPTDPGLDPDSICWDEPRSTIRGRFDSSIDANVIDDGDTVVPPEDCEDTVVIKTREKIVTAALDWDENDN